MQATHARARTAAVPIDERLAGAPISRGVCEVPGWGVMPSPQDVLREPDLGQALEETRRAARLMSVGGTDPVRFAQEHGDRVSDMHVKDVDGGLAAEVRDGKRSLLSATKEGLFTALGRGDARIAEVLDGLQDHGYEGWLVLEQDTAITGDEPTVAGGPMREARKSIAFLHQSARTTEESNR